MNVMSDIDPFRQGVKDWLSGHWKKTFNPFDKERPRVAKYPASITDHVEHELDGVMHVFRVRIEDIGTVEDHLKKAELFANQLQSPMPEAMIAEIQAIEAEFKKDMAEGNFVPV